MRFCTKLQQRVIVFIVLIGILNTMARAKESLREPPGKSDPLHGILADYNAELRGADGRVDCDLMVARLKELGVNTYFWLIWHAATDWDDLHTFLPKAAKAGINVWVYLVPPSESPPYAEWYSEPFRLDYHRWAEEIARLSLKHPNLTAWVIDDFGGNRSLYTPDYLREMQRRAKAINPRLGFLPLMYFPEITPGFVNDYREVIDGVVVAYPPNREQIERAWVVLNDDDGEMARERKGRFHIPFIVMTAGQLKEFGDRHGVPATSERMAEWLRMCLKAWRDGKCDGVVTYALDKEPNSPTFSLAQRLFREFRR